MLNTSNHQEMKIKTTMRCHITPVRLVITKKANDTKSLPRCGWKGREAVAQLFFFSPLSVLFFLFSWSASGEEKWTTPCYQTTSAPGAREWSFDTILESRCGEECSKGVTWVVLIVLRRCRLCCTGVKKIFQRSIGWPRSLQCASIDSDSAAKLDQESWPTYFAFHPQMRHMTSSVGLHELTITSTMCI